MAGLTHELQGLLRVLLIEVDHNRSRAVGNQEVDPVGLATSEVLAEHLIGDRLFHLANLAALRVIGPEDIWEPRETRAEKCEFFAVGSRCRCLIHQLHSLAAAVMR